MMKSTPVSSLVMAQAELLFQLLIVPLNAPAHLGCPDQFDKRSVGAQRRQPVLGRFGLCGRPFDQQPLFGTWSAKPLRVTMRRPHSHSGKARRQCRVAALAPEHRAPSVWGQRFGQPLDTERCGARHTLPPCHRTPAFVFGLGGHRPGAGYPYRGDRLHPNTILQLHLTQRLAPRRFIAIARIRQHDANCQLRRLWPLGSAPALSRAWSETSLASVHRLFSAAADP